MTEQAPKKEAKDAKDNKKKDQKQEEDLVTIILSRVLRTENSKKK